MNENTYVLGVDDEDANRFIMEEIFDDVLDFECVESGQDCLDSIVKRKPDVILLDVSMPKMNGLEVCKKIRADNDNNDIPIIFVSALASAKEKLAGYEVGGDDYVTKPFNPDELKAKVEVAVKQSKAKADLKESSDYAMKTAMTAMSSSAEQGLIVRFLQESFICNGFEELTKKAFECIAEYGVNASIVIENKKQEIEIYKDDNIKRPLEEDAIQQLRSKGRIYTLGNKMIINGERASLLIRDLPEDDEKIGRLRDHLAVLLDGIDARLVAIELEQELISKQVVLGKAIEATQNEIIAIDDIYRSQQVGVVQELSNIAQNLDKEFMTLGLTDEQEQSLIEVVAKAEKNTEILYQKGVELDERFSKIIKQLKDVI